MKVTDNTFTLIIAVYLHLVYSSSLRVRLNFSLSLFWCARVDLVESVSGKVCALENHRGRKNMYSVFEVFICANVHFEDKQREVVGGEGDYFFDVGPGFKYK